MDAKKAIEIIEGTTHIKGGTRNWSDVYTALDVSVNALKKQIPEKPDLEGDGYADGELVYDTWICPNCSEHYKVDYEEYAYCPVCGQKIKHDN